MNRGGDELLLCGLAVPQARGQLVELRQQLVPLGNDALLFGWQKGITRRREEEDLESEYFAP